MPEFDFDRHKRLIAEATDEPKRLALIKLVIAEGARDSLAVHKAPAKVGDNNRC